MNIYAYLFQNPSSYFLDNKRAFSKMDMADILISEAKRGFEQNIEEKNIENSYWKYFDTGFGTLVA